MLLILAILAILLFLAVAIPPGAGSGAAPGSATWSPELGEPDTNTGREGPGLRCL